MGTEQPDDPLRTCAYSGVERPESQMVQIGRHWIAVESKDDAVEFLQQGKEFETVVHGRQTAPPPKLEAILKRSWDLFRKHAGLLMALQLTVSLPLQLASYWNYQTHAGNYPFRFFALSLVLGIISTAGASSLMSVLSASWNGRKPGYGMAWLAVWKRIGAVLLAAILTHLLFIAGFLFCLLPGLLAMVKLMFTQCFIMDGGLTGTQAMNRSSHLSDAKFWWVFGCILLVAIVTLTPVGLAGAIMRHLPPALTTWQFKGCTTAILALPSAFISVFTFVLYTALQTAPIRPHLERP
jgi:hypothetical protein